MFWKKSKDKQSSDKKNKTKTTTTTYRTDGAVTSAGNAVPSYEAKSKVKSSSNSYSSKVTITVSTSQTSTQKQNYSSITTSSYPSQKAILPRQKTEPSITRRLDATPFNSTYESPFRNHNLSTLRTPALPLTSSTTSTTYQSPYRNTKATSSVRETKTTVIAPSRVVTSTAQALLTAPPQKRSTTPIWSPLSSKIENPKPIITQSWNNVSSLPMKAPLTQTITYQPTARKEVTKPSTVVQPVKKKRQSPGVVYIFHNDKFDSPDKEFRVGSAQDVRLLKTTFQSFKMQVNLYENLTVREVDNIVRKIEIKDFGNASCIVVVILTHGTRYETVAARDGSYSIDDNVLFPILRNRSLRSKPKLLFIQACKGPMETAGFHKDAMQPNGIPDEILKCYSTFEGYVAYRTEKGSLFIQSLCELLQAHGKSKNVKDIMDMVIRSVKEKSERTQIPSYETTLTEPYILGDYL